MELRARTKRELEAISELIKEAQEDLFIEASNIAADHWRAASNHEKEPIENRSQYILRVARGKAGVLIQWKRTWYVYDGKQRKHVQRSAYIKRGEGKMRHKLTSFPRAKDWERPIIESIEQRVEYIRRKTHWLAKLAQVLSNHPEIELDRQEKAKARRAKAAADAEAEAGEMLPEEIGW